LVKMSNILLLDFTRLLGYYSGDLKGCL